MKFPNGDLLTEISIHADYEVSTFDQTGAAFLMSELNCPTELMQQIEKWEDDFFILNGKGVNSENVTYEKFDQQGLAIAKLVKRFVGSNVKVLYTPQLSKNTVEISLKSTG